MNLRVQGMETYAFLSGRRISQMRYKTFDNDFFFTHLPCTFVHMHICIYTCTLVVVIYIQKTKQNNVAVVTDEKIP